MRKRPLKIVHYVNQFFGGIGGEDKAYIGPKIVNGPIGPGRLIQENLGGHGDVVATVICGDNYFSEKVEDATKQVIALIKNYQPDGVIAGPAFDAGRYGIACGALCKAVQEQLGIPAVTGMYKENPGVDLYRRYVYIIETADSAKKMAESINRMMSILLKLIDDEKIGKPNLEGYFPRGYLINEISERLGSERLVSMLLAKIKGELFESEVVYPKYDRVEPAPGIKDLHSAIIALATDGGLVPKGNPDRIEARAATRFGSYSIEGKYTLDPGEYEVSHVGYTPVYVLQDVNRLVPVDVMRDLEKEGRIKKLYEKFYSTSGAVCVVENAKRIGQAIAREMKNEGISGVILTST